MSRFHDVVAAHHLDSDAVLVAAREPCITIAVDETRNVTGRTFRMVRPDALDGLVLKQSWVMACLLCDGDDTRRIAEWVAAHQHDPTRVIFYIHEDAEPRLVFRAWHEAGLPIMSTWTIRSWRELHKHFGAAWNVRIYDDFAH